MRCRPASRNCGVWLRSAPKHSVAPCRKRMGKATGLVRPLRNSTHPPLRRRRRKVSARAQRSGEIRTKLRRDPVRMPFPILPLSRRSTPFAMECRLRRNRRALGAGLSSRGA